MKKIYKNAMLFMVMYILSFIIIFIYLQRVFENHDRLQNHIWSFIGIPLMEHSVVSNGDSIIFATNYQYGLFLLPIAISILLIWINKKLASKIKSKFSDYY